MLERLTDSSKQVYSVAENEARSLDHRYVGTKHLLLALIVVDSVAAQALRSLGVLASDVRSHVEKSAAPKAGKSKLPLQYTPAAETVLRLAVEEANLLGQDRAGAEHILLGLLHAGAGDGVDILGQCGVGVDQVRRAVLDTAGQQQLPAEAPPDPRSGRIFISYRREDTSHVAGRIADRLVDHLGEEQVFMDVDSIEIGVDFRKVVTDAVGRCDVLLAIIGRRWATAEDADGNVRLAARDDLVRLEVETALQRNVRVIPVLVDGAAMPRPQQLPESLNALADRNALKIQHETFRQDVRRLVEILAKAL
jgi:hypothetical protein